MTPIGNFHVLMQSMSEYRMIVTGLLALGPTCGLSGSIWIATAGVEAE